jgi:hypothetical protein
MMEDFIFVLGAPGSRWSGVAKSIYFSSDIDRSDDTAERRYHNPATKDLMHLGAYWDPGMEFGHRFDKFDRLSKTDLIEEFNRPFSGTGKRIIKSHILTEHVGDLALLFHAPIVLVYRTNQDCFDWWHEAGGWAITYPTYGWYKDDAGMRAEIARQNAALTKFKDQHGLYTVANNTELAGKLGISKPANYLSFTDCDVYVKLPV